MSKEKKGSGEVDDDPTCRPRGYENVDPREAQSLEGRII